MRKESILFIAALVFVSSYLFFLHLDGFALTDPDETFYAQTAKEMFERREWHTPYLYGEPQFEKPILFYWLVEASYVLFGVNEFSSRFPSAVFALIGIIIVYLLGTLLFNRRAAFLASIILATSVEYIILARACITDMVLTTFVSLGFLLFFYAYLKGKRYFYILASAAFALAVLTKGPIGLILPAGIILIYLAMVKDLKAIWRMPLFSCALVFLAIALPWYITMYRIHGKDFIDVFFGFHNITRFVVSEHRIGSQFYYNVPIVLGGMFPWSVFLPFGLWQAFKKTRTTDSRNNPGLFILLWFAVIFIFFSISSTKLPTYIFPSFPALAFIIAILWDDFLREPQDSRIFGWLKFGYFILLVSAFLGAAALYIFIRLRYPTILFGAGASGMILTAGFLSAFIAFIKKKEMISFFLIITTVILFFLPFQRMVLPELERYETTKEIAQKLIILMKNTDGIGAESYYRPGVAFYTGKIPVDLDKHESLIRFLPSKNRVWGVIKEKNHIQLYVLDTRPLYYEPSYMVYQVGKKCIITNKVPDDGKYIIKRERPR